MVGCLALLCGVAACAIGCTAAVRYVGPPSDHFDGKRFRNLGPFAERGLGDLLRWKLSGPRATPWPAFVNVPLAAPPPRRVQGGVRVTFVNHATVLIQLGGVNVLTDPVWSERVGPTSVIGQRRHKPAGVRFEDLPPIDVVLISHNHYDHLDMPTLKRLQRRDGPLVLAGLGTAALLKGHGIARAEDMDWWQERQVGPKGQTGEMGAVRVTFAPAQHWSTRVGLDRNYNLWGSFYLVAGAERVYFAGDTGPGPHFQMIRDRLGTPTLALLPIGAYLPRWFMQPQHIDPAEAVAAHLLLGARRSVAIHWGTFRQADEGMVDPVVALRAALQARGVAAEDFMVLENGQALVE